MFAVDEAFLILATFSIAFIIVYLLRRKGRNDGSKRRAPCLPALPLVGSLPFFRGGIDEMPGFFMRKAESLGPVFHFYAGSKLAVVLNDRNAIYDALVRHSEAFADRTDFWTESNVTNVNLKGIAFSHYHDTFKHHHKLILSILKEFGFGAVRETEFRFLEEVAVMLREIHEQNGRPFHPKYTLSVATASIMMKILFGKQATSVIKSRELLEASSNYAHSLDPKIDAAPILRFLPKYRMMLATMVRCQNKMMEHFELAIKHSQSEDSEINFVKRFLQIEGPDYDHENLLYTLRDLTLTSSDTVSTTLEWTLIELANHPEVQSRLQKEIDNLIPDSRLPSFDDKPHLPYTEAVILESMRRRTIGPFAVPHMTAKDTEVCGYYIPRGCMVIPNLYAAHMNAKDWNDPENFRPERFLDGENKVIGREKVIPFGLGKRSCIGEILARHELFLMLTSLVQQFEFRPPEGEDSINVKEILSISLCPSPYEMRLIPRKRA